MSCYDNVGWQSIDILTVDLAGGDNLYVVAVELLVGVVDVFATERVRPVFLPGELTHDDAQALVHGTQRDTAVLGRVD